MELLASEEVTAAGGAEGGIGGGSAESSSSSSSSGAEAGAAKAEEPPLPPGVVRLDGVSPAEHKELEERSALFRSYLMVNVMPVLTQGMLKTVESNPEDPIEFLSDYLIFQGKLAERVAEAQAFLQFKAMIAKAKWLEKLEKAEEEAAAAAAQDDDDDEDED